MILGGGGVPCQNVASKRPEVTQTWNVYLSPPPGAALKTSGMSSFFYCLDKYHLPSVPLSKDHVCLFILCLGGCESFKSIRCLLLSYELHL